MSGRTPCALAKTFCARGLESVGAQLPGRRGYETALDATKGLVDHDLAVSGFMRWRGQTTPRAAQGACRVLAWDDDTDGDSGGDDDDDSCE